MKEFTRKLIEDRLVIKATQRLRRHIKPKEIGLFFSKNNYKIDSIEREFIKAIDKTINEFLGGKQ